MIQIQIGDRVCLHSPVSIRGYSSTHIELNMAIRTNAYEKDVKIIIPRYISNLGQNQVGFARKIPKSQNDENSQIVYDDNFEYNGKYSIGNNLYEAPLMTQEQLDSEIDDCIGGVIDGEAFIGEVVAIFAEYSINEGYGPVPDIELFSNSEEAKMDHYAHEVYAVIQDHNFTEWYIPITCLKKI